MTWLQVLDISANSLTCIAPDIARLEDLRELNVSENKSRELQVPEAIGELSQLRKLRFIDTHFVSFPANIGNCYNLTLLNLGILD